MCNYNLVSLQEKLKEMQRKQWAVTKWVPSLAQLLYEWEIVWSETDTAEEKGTSANLGPGGTLKFSCTQQEGCFYRQPIRILKELILPHTVLLVVSQQVTLLLLLLLPFFLCFVWLVWISMMPWLIVIL